MITISNILEVKEHLQGMEAVVFDLDDTLYGEKEYIRSGYRAISKILPQVEDCEEKLWEAFLNNTSAIDEVLRKEGLYTEELKKLCLEVYRSHKPQIHLYPGVKELLLEIKKSGLKLGIITDGRPVGQRNKLEALGLYDFFSKVIITDELGGTDCRKPCPLSFELMGKELLTPFEKMCYVGDNISKDFIAPDSLGMRSIWFKNTDGIYYDGQSLRGIWG